MKSCLCRLHRPFRGGGGSVTGALTCMGDVDLPAGSAPTSSPKCNEPANDDRVVGMEDLRLLLKEDRATFPKQVGEIAVDCLGAGACLIEICGSPKLSPLGPSCRTFALESYNHRDRANPCSLGEDAGFPL